MIRELELNFSQKLGDFVEGLNSKASAVLPPFVKGDMYQISLKNLVIDTAIPAKTYFLQKPWSFGSIRASIGYIDGAPDAGKFKLRVEEEDTDEITFPGATATAGQIATFKADVVAKLEALAGVGAGNVTLTDPAGTPGHFIYLSWTDDDDDRAISVVGNKLVPVCLPRVEAQKAKPGYQQLIKLIQAPIVEAIEFSFPGADQPTVEEIREGQVGTNEKQRLTIAEGSIGSLEVSYSGAPSSSLPVPGVTAITLAEALNALVPGGDTTPGFKVTALQGAGGVFEIEFIGPLAAAPHDELGAVLRPSVPPMTAIGDLDMRQPRFSRVLNGAKSGKLSLEVAISQDGSDRLTIIREITILADMTGPETPGELEALGSVLTLTDTVYVDNGLGVPYVEAAQGEAYTPPAAVAAGAALVINHAKDTRTPLVRVSYRTSMDPEEWSDLPLNEEWSFKSTTANHVSLYFTFDITDVLETDDKDRGRFRIFVGSTSSAIGIFNHEHTWAQSRLTLPDGMTAAAKFAAIDAALGMLGGTLVIQLGNVEGTLSPDNIDLEALILAIIDMLKSDATLLAAFVTLITDETVLKAIATSFTDLQEFIDLIKSTLAKSEVIETLFDELKKSSTFLESIRQLILDVLQGVALPPEGWTVWSVPAFALSYPPYQEIPAPPTYVNIPVEITAVSSTGKLTTKTITGGNEFENTTTTDEPATSTTTEKRTRNDELSSPNSIRFYLPLSMAVINGVDGGELSGELPATETLDEVFTVGGAGAFSRDNAGRRGEKFAAGAFITYKNGHWFEVVEIGADNWYPKAYEVEVLAPVLHTIDQLYEGSRFALDFGVRLECENKSLIGAASVRAEIVFETGEFEAEDAGHDIEDIEWTARATVVVYISAAAVTHRFAVKIERTDEGLTGEFMKYGQWSAFSVPSANGAMRCRLTKLDPQNVTDARATIHISQTGAVASISPIE